MFNTGTLLPVPIGFVGINSKTPESSRWANHHIKDKSPTKNIEKGLKITQLNLNDPYQLIFYSLEICFKIGSLIHLRIKDTRRPGILTTELMLPITLVAEIKRILLFHNDRNLLFPCY